MIDRKDFIKTIDDLCEYHLDRMEVVHIDVSNITTSKQLHERLKQSLESPDFYGMNWNAFWDAITGLVEIPKKLIIVGWKNLVRNIPEDG